MDVPGLLRAAVFGYREAPVWHLTATMLVPDSWIPPAPRPPDLHGRYVVGRSGDREWFGWSHDPALVPWVVADGAAAWVRDRMAVYAWEAPPTLSRLEKVVGDAWVATDLTTVRSRGWTSAAAEADMYTSILTPDDLAAAEALVSSPDEVTVACGGRVWHVDPRTLDWRTDQIVDLLDVRLSYSEPDPPVAPPTGPGVLDAAAIAGPLGLNRVPRKRSAASPDVSPPEDGETTWSVTSYDLAEHLRADHCVAAEEQVRRALAARAPKLLRRVEFDSEMSMFAAYCGSRADAIELCAVVDDLIAGA